MDKANLDERRSHRLPKRMGPSFYTIRMYKISEGNGISATKDQPTPQACLCQVFFIAFAVKRRNETLPTFR